MRKAQVGYSSISQCTAAIIKKITMTPYITSVADPGGGVRGFNAPPRVFACQYMKIPP